MFCCRYARLYASENPNDVAAVLNIDGAITDVSDWNAARPAFTLLSPYAFKLCRLGSATRALCCRVHHHA